ncbi:MAG: hypothetical protein KF842_10360 [Caulobacter sp.]|nr:hypothetical protein [Caulobacter sp.]
MRSRFMLASLLAISATVPAGARAETLDVASEFETICLANRPELIKAIETAKGRGFTVQPSAAKPPPPLKFSLVLGRPTDNGRWAVVVATGAAEATETTPAQRFLSCTIVASGADPRVAEAMKRRLGVSPSVATGSTTKFYFREAGGRRLPLNPADQAAIAAAIDNDGFYLVQIDIRDQSTVATITRSSAAK